MLERKVVKGSAKMKNRNEPVVPRRRPSVASGGIGRVTRALSRPVSGTAQTVTPSSNANIKVFIRVRPPNTKEQEENNYTVVKVVNRQVLVFDPKEEETPFFYHGVQQKNRDLLKKVKKDMTFSFNRVFDVETTNSDVFFDSTKQLIDTLMDGCNCSVFAYGATGAGKTFTMIGTDESPGITFLTMEELFKRKEELCSERDFELMLTYIEVYNELVKDLLNPGPPLNLLEDAKYGVRVQGITGHKINNPDDLFSLLEQGNKKRTQHPTDANAESSRSHAVFQVYIQMKMKGTKEVRQAKLSMIDLAGSERGSATGFIGARFKEGANINKSLLALGNCINSLADGQRHVPYRDSKLTRLLKDSLGGNCHTIMIANVSPSSLSFEDTYNTLKYASRASQIKTTIKRNIVNVDMHIDQYIKLVEDLQTENSALKADNANLKADNSSLKAENSKLQSRIAELENAEKSGTCLKDVTNQPDEVVEVEVAEVSAETMTRFKMLLENEKEALEREFRLRCSELGMALKRELKSEARDRLSSLYTETPDREERRRKLNEQVGRFQRKEFSVKKEISEIQIIKGHIQTNIQSMLKEFPALKAEHQAAAAELEILDYQFKVGLKEKEMEVLLSEHKEKCALIEEMSKYIKRCFLALGGKQDAPESVRNGYEGLVSFLGGMNNIKFEASEGLNDLPISSPVSDENGRKRKMDTDSQVSLNTTFGIKGDPKSPAPSASSGLNSQLVTTGPKVPTKRMANAVSPRVTYRPKCSPKSKTPIRLGRVASVRNATNRKVTKTIAERPRFKF